MKRNYYTIKDKVANAFGDLMYCSSDEVAKREFVNIIRKLHINKDDLELYWVGMLDDTTGIFNSTLGTHLVVSGSDVNVPNIDGLEEILFRLSTLEQICKDKQNNA